MALQPCWSQCHFRKTPTFSYMQDSDSEALGVCRNLKITNSSGIFMPLHRTIASLHKRDLLLVKLSKNEKSGKVRQ